MDSIERFSGRMPGFARLAPAFSTVLGAIGALALFAATILGSILLALGGLAAFALAGVLWYIGDFARHQG